MSDIRTKDDSRVRFLKPRQVPEVGCLSVFVTSDDSQNGLLQRLQYPQYICVTNTSQRLITEDQCCPELLLMYFIGAATETTILSSGKLSIRALRRLSYSSEGTPGVSSLGLTTCRHRHQLFSKRTRLPGPTKMWVRLEDGLAIY
jgi:hypothetical protein